MADTVEKLTTGEPLSIDQLIEYLPALKEIPRAQLENWAKGAAVLHRFRKGGRILPHSLRHGARVAVDARWRNRAHLSEPRRLLR